MLIGLAGYARSGKDTVADMILELVPGMIKYSYADPLKRCMNDWLGWGEEHGWGSLKDVSLPVTSAAYSTLPIYIYKHFNMFGINEDDCFNLAMDLKKLLATDARIYSRRVTLPGSSNRVMVVSPREVYQLFGTEVMRAYRETFWVDIAPKDNAVIADVRFHNEAKSVQDNPKGTLVKVNNPTKGPQSDHASEQDIRDMRDDYAIANRISVEFTEKANLAILKDNVTEMLTHYEVI